MADFSFLSDTDESAVDQVLAEAMDHCVLEQIAAINCSSFSDFNLPSHLESRFQRLKTFPSSSSSKPNPKTQLAPNSANSFKDSANEGEQPSYGNVSSPSDSSNSPSGHANSPKFRAKSGDGQVKNGKFHSGSFSFLSNSPKFRAKSGDGQVTNENFRSGSFTLRSNSPKFRAEFDDGKAKRGKLRSRSFSLRSNSSNSSTETVKSGCFWCSPKKNSRKKSGSRNGVVELGFNWGNDDEILSDLKSFSSKEQKKVMKKAIKEEEKIIKEAEKIVKWAKQSSSRMDFSLSDDELSDDADSGHTFGHH